MERFNSIEHLDSNLWNHHIPFVFAHGLQQVLNALWKVCHHKEAAAFVEGVRDVLRNFDIVALFLH